MNEDALKAKLKTIAHEKSHTFNQVWKQFLLERFLARLAQSDYRDKFIFKGGLLLASYLEIGRETVDIDFLLTKLKAEEEQIKSSFLSIISNSLDDGIVFLWNKIDILDHSHMEYIGFRVFLHVRFDKMKDKIQIDIGIGDKVTPLQREFSRFEYKNQPIFKDKINLFAYPPEDIFSEKLESIVSRGALNSRMKDYHDVLLMTRALGLLDILKLKVSISETFQHRKTEPLFPIRIDEAGMLSLQRLWSNHLRSLGNYQIKLNLPQYIEELIAEVNRWLIDQEIGPNLTPP